MRWTSIAVILALAVAAPASEDATLGAATKLARSLGAADSPALIEKLKAAIVVNNPKAVPPSAEPVLEEWLREVLESPEWNLTMAEVLLSHLQPDDIVELQSLLETQAWRHYQEARSEIDDAFSTQLNQMMRERGPELRRRLAEAKRSR